MLHFYLHIEYVHHEAQFLGATSSSSSLLVCNSSRSSIEHELCMHCWYIMSNSEQTNKDMIKFIHAFVSRHNFGSVWTTSCASELDLSILPATCTPRIADDQRRAAPALAAGLGFGFELTLMREEDDYTTKFYHMKMLMAICRRILLARRAARRGSNLTTKPRSYISQRIGVVTLFLQRFLIWLGFFKPLKRSNYRLRRELCMIVITNSICLPSSYWSPTSTAATTSPTYEIAMPKRVYTCCLLSLFRIM